MRRRRFLVWTGALWAAGLRAQGAKRARVGVLISGNPEPFFTAFKKALSAEGFHAGSNVGIELRSDRDQARPLPRLGGNINRVSGATGEIAAKCVEVLKEDDLTVNLKTAKALEFAVPRAMLLRAELTQ